MADDGTGAGLVIPGVMISKKDGDILLEHLTKGHESAEVVVNFPFPN